MFDSTLRHCLVATILAMLALGSAHAAEPNIAVLRVESLDAVLADVEKTLALADVKIGGDMIEQQIVATLGIGDLSWVDRSRPLSLVYPMKGMMLGDRILSEERALKFESVPKTLERRPNLWEQWHQACLGGQKAGSSFDWAERLTEFVLLGNLAIRTGQRLEWHPGKRTFLNNESANQLLHEDYRSGWAL